MNFLTDDTEPPYPPGLNISYLSQYRVVSVIGEGGKHLLNIDKEIQANMDVSW